MTYRINSRGAPPGAVGAIIRAASSWNHVKSSSFSFIYKGETEKEPFIGMDGTNLVAFEVSEPEYAEYVAYNSYFYDIRTGEIMESDITVNMRHAFSTEGTDTAYDVQNIATHEFGHSAGLADLCLEPEPCGPEDPRAQYTMYAWSEPGETKKSTLEDDDEAGITYLYPNRGFTPAYFLLK